MVCLPALGARRTTNQGGVKQEGSILIMPPAVLVGGGTKSGERKKRTDEPGMEKDKRWEFHFQVNFKSLCHFEFNISMVCCL